MKLIYRKPALFEEITGFACFKDYQKMNSVISFAGYQLGSKNVDFLAFIPIYAPPDPAKSQRYF